MKFKFCGNIDCPDWLITEIIFLTKISAVKLRILGNQISTFIMKKGQNLKDIMNILEDMKFSEKEAHIIISVLEFILKNAAKFDIEDLVLNQELQQLGLPQENAESISKVFKMKKGALREALTKSIFGFNSIDDVDYKISYVLCDHNSEFNCTNEKENEDLNEDNYQIHSLEKHRVNLTFNSGAGKKYNLVVDKETLGKMIKDLERYSEVIKKYKEEA